MTDEQKTLILEAVQQAIDGLITANELANKIPVRRSAVVHYFPEMVRIAVAEARKIIHSMPNVRAA